MAGETSARQILNFAPEGMRAAGTGKTGSHMGGIQYLSVDWRLAGHTDLSMGESTWEKMISNLFEIAYKIMSASNWSEKARPNERGRVQTTKIPPKEEK